MVQYPWRGPKLLIVSEKSLNIDMLLEKDAIETFCYITKNSSIIMFGVVCVVF